jgi:recombination protein RecR
MNSIESLTELFRKFPGIGPRQARRFVYFLLRDGKGIYSQKLIEEVENLKKNIHMCPSCKRFSPSQEIDTLCNICSNTNRDASTLLCVAYDTDIDPIERSRTYNGRYFVLGGLLPLLEKSPEKRIRGQALLSNIQNSKPTEIIIALNANAEGDHTVEYLRDILKETGIKISILGRGLSTGTELEYSDPETLKYALQSRT